MSKNGGLGYAIFRIRRRKSDSYLHLSDIERDMDIRGTVPKLVGIIRTNANEENSGSHAFPGPTCAMG